ncbi:hypothetical protein C2E25_16515 [Geothermobacter hydrogeniphilus]|uniref:Uncharacterized protein n=1 Tax=Geothermobacter hydrogeniphilus TaxID=1969733 RepID=A0A2K2H5X0_9BACT|nr:CsgG/HfaB family protein [Geothermobacter hydrogeniphilus]PNU18651.1 hypothetical protein C2E25_16515 [Geothermobacter hydrogeniphilus]
MKSSVWLLLVLLAIGTSAFAESSPVLAIFPFTGTADEPSSGKELSGMLTSMLARDGRLEVVERQQLGILEREKLLKGGGDEADDQGDAPADVTSSRMLGADLVLLGDLMGSHGHYQGQVRLVDLHWQRRVLRVEATGESLPVLSENLLEAVTSALKLYGAYQSDLVSSSAGKTEISEPLKEEDPAREIDRKEDHPDLLDEEITRRLAQNRRAQKAGMKVFTGVPVFGMPAGMLLGGSTGRTLQKNLRPSTLSMAAGVATGLLSWLFYDCHSSRGGTLTGGFSLYFFYNGIKLRKLENEQIQLEKWHRAGAAD